MAVSHNAGVALSQIVYSNVSIPSNPGFGVYVYSPLGAIVTVPFVGSVFSVTEIVSPSSGSKSFTNTFPSTGTSISVTFTSLIATGGSFPIIGSSTIVMVTFAVSQAIGLPPSHI